MSHDDLIVISSRHRTVEQTPSTFGLVVIVASMIGLVGITLWRLVQKDFANGVVLLIVCISYVTMLVVMTSPCMRVYRVRHPAVSPSQLDPISSVIGKTLVKPVPTKQNFCLSPRLKESSRNPSDMDLCAICLDSGASQSLYETACGHVFHDSCLRKWLEMKCKCPLCSSRVCSLCAKQNPGFVIHSPV